MLQAVNVRHTVYRRHKFVWTIDTSRSKQIERCFIYLKITIFYHTEMQLFNILLKQRILQSQYLLTSI